MEMIHVAEIRARLVMELALNEEYYLREDNLKKGNSKSTWTSKHNQAFAMYSPEYVPGARMSEETIKTIYELEVMKACKPKTYLGIWQLFGIASVLQMQVFSVYPNLGNKYVRRDLHRLIQPRIKTSDDIAYIMWSSTRKDMTSSNWIPNHFVAVLAVDTGKETNEVLVTSEPNTLGIQKVTLGGTGQPGVQEVTSEDPGKSGIQEIVPEDPGQPGLQEIIPEEPGQSGVHVVIPEEPGKSSIQEIISEDHGQPCLQEIIPEEPGQSGVHEVPPQEPSQAAIEEVTPYVLFTEFPPAKDCLGKYVIVLYNKVRYPGYVEDTSKCDVYVSCMHKVGQDPGQNCFFWPEVVKDTCWYEHHNILAIIPEPKKIDSSYRHYEVAPALWKTIMHSLNNNE